MFSLHSSRTGIYKSQFKPIEVTVFWESMLEHQSIVDTKGLLWIIRSSDICQSEAVTSVNQLTMTTPLLCNIRLLSHSARSPKNIHKQYMTYTHNTQKYTQVLNIQNSQSHLLGAIVLLRSSKQRALWGTYTALY